MIFPKCRASSILSAIEVVIVAALFLFLFGSFWGWFAFAAVIFADIAYIALKARRGARGGGGTD
jgi:hypothetical protein